ncbi:MAG: hypothetical protein ACOYI9_04490 [Candidatus Hydrogenedentales bacterium]
MNRKNKQYLVLLGVMVGICLTVFSSAAQDVTEAQTVSGVNENQQASIPENTVEVIPLESLSPSSENTVIDQVSDQVIAISEAEEYLRRGVELYKKDLYREALTEFNRALALDPSLESARSFQEKTNAKLAQTVGVTAAADAAPTFLTVDPAALRATEGKMDLSADEIRRDRVRELLGFGVQYMEAERYATAVEIYSNVLLIDPENSEAKEMLHKATIGAHKQAVTESEAGVMEDRERIRNFIESSKRLPEGADARGIKPFRFSVPEIEEVGSESKEKSPIEQILESPVSIEFEDIHISEIVDFIADSWDVNIVIDNRVVAPPPKESPIYGTQQAPGMPGGPGAMPPGIPGAPSPAPFPPAGAAPAPQPGAVPGSTVATSEVDEIYGEKTDGRVPYINMKNVSLAEALQALLRPLGLDYAVQPGFIWITRPSVIRRESFEKLETRYYELRNAGSETLFKVVLRNSFGGIAGGGMGGMGGGMGGYGGGMGGGRMGGMGGGMGGYGGGMGGGMGGYGGGMGGGMGGYGGGMGGGMGGYGGGMGGGMGGYGGGMGGGMMGGGMGGYGGGMGGGMMGGGMGGYGGGMGGGRMGGMGGGMGGGMMDVTAISNISDLFTTISDMMVGEAPALPEVVGLSRVGTGATGSMLGAGGTAVAQQGATLGTGSTAASSGLGGDVLTLLERLVPQVYEPYSDELLSDMIYNPANNMLIVKNTPTNLEEFEKQLAEIDITPKQVSIEAKFLTIRLEDLKKIGFNWDATLSDQNMRSRKIDELANRTYNYDINGDGTDERIPFYTRPDGTPTIANTITDATIGALINPPSSAEPTFSILGNILKNEDGDKLSVTFDYLDGLDESELLSAPRVTTMNRKPAVIADFATEYFISQISTEVYANIGYGYGNSGATTSFIQNVIPQPYNFGIALSVTPQIRDNNQVRLWLNPEVRTKTGSKTFQQKQIISDQEIVNEINLPTTSWQAVWTNVIVHDGDTLVLGGLVQDQSSKGTQKMPYVADIPVIGFFFKGTKREAKQSSLLIFVTPDIIDSTGARFFDVTEMPS